MSYQCSRYFPSLQEHRIRASTLPVTLEQEALVPLNDVFLEDPQADLRSDIQRAPYMMMTTVFHLCNTSLAVALLGRLDCHRQSMDDATCWTELKPKKCCIGETQFSSCWFRWPSQPVREAANPVNLDLVGLGPLATDRGPIDGLQGTPRYFSVSHGATDQGTQDHGARTKDHRQLPSSVDQCACMCVCVFAYVCHIVCAGISIGTSTGTTTTTTTTMTTSISRRREKREQGEAREKEGRSQGEAAEEKDGRSKKHMNHNEEKSRRWNRIRMNFN